VLISVVSSNTNEKYFASLILFKFTSRISVPHASINWFPDAKLFELMVYRVMYEDLRVHLADCEHGFVKSRWTVSNLIEYSSFVLKSIEDGCQVDSIYTYFSKAFGRVRHCFLLEKMSGSIELARCQSLRS
jgi:hypothetical protein